MEVPALGSPRDIVFREYMLHEAKLEASKHKMMLLLTMGSPMITDASARRTWNEQSQKAYSQYINLLMGIEVPEEDPEEQRMKDFYENVVKTAQPTLHKDGQGKLFVTGVDEIFYPGN